MFEPSTVGDGSKTHWVLFVASILSTFGAMIAYEMGALWLTIPLLVAAFVLALIMTRKWPRPSK